MSCYFTGRSIINKKSDGSNVKESTDSSTTIEEDDVKGKIRHVSILLTLYLIRPIPTCPISKISLDLASFSWPIIFAIGHTFEN